MLEKQFLSSEIIMKNLVVDYLGGGKLAGACLVHQAFHQLSDSRRYSGEVRLDIKKQYGRVKSLPAYAQTDITVFSTASGAGLRLLFRGQIGVGTAGGAGRKQGGTGGLSLRQLNPQGFASIGGAIQISAINTASQNRLADMALLFIFQPIPRSALRTGNLHFLTPPPVESDKVMQ